MQGLCSGYVFMVLMWSDARAAEPFALLDLNAYPMLVSFVFVFDNLFVCLSAWLRSCRCMANGASRGVQNLLAHWGIFMVPAPGKENALNELQWLFWFSKARERVPAIGRSFLFIDMIHLPCRLVDVAQVGCPTDLSADSAFSIRLSRKLVVKG